MTSARAALVSATLALAILGTIWVVRDDRFGRPESIPRPPLAGDKFILEPPPVTDQLKAAFALCDGPIRVNCVVDGDTFWFKGDKIRIADIDAPEISSPHCEDEKYVGGIARERLLELLNAGAFTLQSGWRDTDRFGRKLRTITRDYRSLGEMLVQEGLARRWSEPRRDWCNSE